MCSISIYHVQGCQKSQKVVLLEYKKLNLNYRVHYNYGFRACLSELKKVVRDGGCFKKVESQQWNRIENVSLLQKLQ